MTDRPVVDVWFVADPEQIEPSGLDVLSPAERRRADRYRRAEDRTRSLIAALIVRRVVARHCGISPAAVAVDRTCPSCGAEHGPPRVPGDLWLSVSHCQGAVLVASCAGHRIGIDAEPYRRSPEADLAGIAESIVGALEEPLTDPRSVIRTWVRKEAVLKSTGVGLTVDPRSVRVSAATDPPVVLGYDPDPALRLWLADVELPESPGLAAAVATVGPPAQVIIHDGRSLIAG